MDILTPARSVLVGIRMALNEMRTHKLRSVLSVLGVMLGVASLVAMLTLIGGIDVFLNQKMGKWIGSVWFSQKWDPPEEEKLSWARSPRMRLSDGAYLEKNSPAVKNIPAVVSRYGQLKIGGSSDNGMVRGLDPAALALDRDEIRLDRGRWLTDEDFVLGNRNCLISWQLVESLSSRMKLKNTGALLGRNVVFRNVRFTIIGTYEPANPENEPRHLRRGIIIPLKAMQKYVTGSDPDPGNLQVQVTDPRLVKEQSQQIATALAGRHRGVQDFEYRTAEWLDNVKIMLNNVSLLMVIVSVLSLLVGGLSIMNVMLSSISERIKEIGTRKALGAQNLQIFIQFVAETTTLSFAGGILGIALGIVPLLFREPIMRSTDGAIAPTVLAIHMLYTMLIICSVGVIFGLYPAIKAARMNPVEALRYE